MVRNYKRKGEEVIDQTRGVGNKEPVNYKGDVMVQVWIDSRILATLSEWIDSLGCVSRFMSEAVKEPLRVLVEHLVESGEVDMIDDTATARKMLERKYRVNLNPQGRGMKNVLHNIHLSERRRQLGQRIRKERRNDSIQPMVDRVKESNSEMLSREKQEELLEIYKKLEQEEMEEAKQRDLEKIKEMNLPREGELVSEEKVLKEGEVSDEEREREDKAYIEQLKNAKPLESQMVKLEEE